MKKIFISVLAFSVAACGLFNRNSSNYWLNNIRSYTTYPVSYYDGDEFDTSEKELESQEIATHTYQRNVVVSANVGQRMVDSQTFGVKKFTQNKIMALNDATISTISDEIHIKKGQEFMPVGEVLIDGSYYMLIKGDDMGAILLVDETGNVINKICTLYKGDLMFSRDYAVINPTGLKIAPTDTTRTDVSALKQNFEIVFDGYKDGMIEFTYIGSDEEKAQKYIYRQQPQNININGVRINITGIYPDRIEYMLPE